MQWPKELKKILSELPQLLILDADIVYIQCNKFEYNCLVFVLLQAC
jgi:hypothetical protein